MRLPQVPRPAHDPRAPSCRTGSSSGTIIDAETLLQDTAPAAYPTRRPIVEPERPERHCPEPTGSAVPADTAAAAHASRHHVTRYGRIVEQGPTAILADHATSFMLQHLVVQRGDRVAEPGCGTGILSLFAALAGALNVVGTDVDPEAVTAASRNAVLNRIANALFVRGHLLEPVTTGLDLVVALLPHKPAPRPFNPRYYGGTDGTDLLLEAIRQSAERLTGGGRLVLYVNSIANPLRVARELERSFDVRLLGEKRRYFTREEFDRLTPGMFAHLEAQAARGEADFRSDDKGLYFMARIYEGARR
ncbi:MAG: 50S ribosomal protein L11 methyltransferase [Planctomycetota bacterium]